MPCDQQRDELVSEVAIRGRVAVLVALLEQQVEHRVVAALRAPARDEVEQQRVEALDGDAKVAPRAARPEVALHEHHREHARERAHAVERAVDGVAQPRRLVVVARSEQHAHDRLEREVLHPFERHDATAPAAQLLSRELSDGRREGAHALAVERSLDQAALAQVLLAVEHEDRVRAGERTQELPALAGRRDRRIEAEQLTDGGRVGEQHHRLVGPEGADRDRVAEALVDRAQEGRRPRRPRDGLPGGGCARAGRKLHSPSLRREDSRVAPALSGNNLEKWGTTRRWRGASDR